MRNVLFLQLQQCRRIGLCIICMCRCHARKLSVFLRYFFPWISSLLSGPAAARVFVRRIHTFTRLLLGPNRIERSEVPAKLEKYRWPWKVSPRLPFDCLLQVYSIHECRDHQYTSKSARFTHNNTAAIGNFAGIHLWILYLRNVICTHVFVRVQHSSLMVFFERFSFPLEN